MNVIGERQHFEKFLPKVVRAAITGEEILLHTDAAGKTSARTYLHGKDVADALYFIMQIPACREKYNIEGQQEVSNEDLVKSVSLTLDKPILTKKGMPTTRPGNDARYHVDGSKLRALGWKPGLSFKKRLGMTVWWMAQPENLHWLGLGKE
jgi:dTDP-glucose 4,6-dehydratase